MSAKVGTRVKIRPSLAVGLHHSRRWATVVAGPKNQFGVLKYQVTIDLVGRETVRQTVWLPASSLLVPKEKQESAS